MSTTDRSTTALVIGATLSCVAALASVSSPASAASAGTAAGPPVSARSCSAPQGVTCISGVPYAHGGREHTLDVYYPTGASGEPSILLIHGGGWKSNDSRLLAHEGRYLAQNGFAAFSINYTLSTPSQPSWPQVFADVEAAARWVHKHAKVYGAKGSRIGAFGPSAGGHLSALLDTKGPEDGIRLKAAVSLSGPMDLGVVYREGGGEASTAVPQLLGCIPGSCPNHEDVDASPVSHVTPDDGAMLLFNSATEVIPVDQAYEMDDALQAAGVPHQLVVVSGSTHARGYECRQETVLGHTSTVIDGAVRWFDKFLKRVSSPPTGTYCG